MNKIFLIGRLGGAPVTQTTRTGKTVCGFSLAVRRTFGEKDEVDWFRVSTWGKQAENVQKYLQKGSSVAVVGSAYLNTYKDRNGNDKVSISVTADSVEFIGSKRDAANEDEANETASERPQQGPDEMLVSDEDMPF